MTYSLTKRKVCSDSAFQPAFRDQTDHKFLGTSCTPALRGTLGVESGATGVVGRVLGGFQPGIIARLALCSLLGWAISEIDDRSRDWSGSIHSGFVRKAETNLASG
jgi:hypothetical protein